MVDMSPMRHWTDSKISCHILSCIVALSYLHLLELRLTKDGLKLSAASAMQQMRALHSCLCWNVGARKAIRKLEEPSKGQDNEGYGLRSEQWGLTGIDELTWLSCIRFMKIRHAIC